MKKGYVMDSDTFKHEVITMGRTLNDDHQAAQGKILSRWLSNFCSEGQEMGS